MKDWHEPKPEPFKKQPCRLPGWDNHTDAQELEGSAYKVRLGADVVAGALTTSKSLANGGE